MVHPFSISTLKTHYSEGPKNGKLPSFVFWKTIVDCDFVGGLKQAVLKNHEFECRDTSMF